MSSSATTMNEAPAFVRAGENTLFAILTSPTVKSNGTAIVVLPGLVPTYGFGREATYLCRLVATQGYHAVRFDYHGMGDSTGVVSQMHLENLFVQDLEPVLGWLRSLGLERFVLVGNCFGSRTALSLAAATDDVALLALAAPPIRDFELGQRREIAAASKLTGWQFVRKAVHPRTVKRLLSRRKRRRYAVMAKAKLGTVSGRVRPGGDDRWVSQPFLRDLLAVVQRGIPTLLVYGEEDDFYRDIEQALPGRLGRIVESSGGLVEIRTLPGAMHDYRDAERQRAVQDLVSDWIRARDAAGGVAGAPAGAGHAGEAVNQTDPKPRVARSSASGVPSDVPHRGGARET